MFPLPSQVPTMPSRPLSPDHNMPNHSTIFISATLCSIIILFFILLFLYIYFSFRRRRSPTLPFDAVPTASLMRFRSRDLHSATANFHHSRLLGRGASASVYRAVLPDGKSVAVKSLSSASPLYDQEFKNELSILSNIRPSPYVVTLLGYCDRRFLVYEYLPKGSLQTALFCSDGGLSWELRFRVILDVAMGLEFLHFACDPPVVHGDIKPSNVLLGIDFRAKIADFGLAKLKVEEEFSQDLGVFSTSPSFDFEFSRAVRVSSSNFEGRVRCNPIASLEEMKGKEATVAPLDDDGDVVVVYSVENSKELGDGDWWWKQDGSGELDGKDYVSEWIESQIRNSGNLDCNNEEKKVERKRRDENIGDSCRKKSASVKEWWKEEYFEEMSKKSSIVKCNKRRHWFKKSGTIDRELKGVWNMKKKKRSKSVGSEMFSGDLFSKELSSSATSMRGTICYVAPEHNGCVRYMEKSDVYSLGVLILVVISGRRPLHVLSSPVKLERANLISWCRQLASSGNIFDLVDERLKDSYNKEQVSLCINLALLCLQKLPELRPDSGEVVKILKGEMDIPNVPFQFSPSPNSKMLSKSKRKTAPNLE